MAARSLPASRVASDAISARSTRSLTRVLPTEPTAVDATVGMELLGHVDLDRDGWDLDRRDLGEDQEVGPAQPVELDAGGWVEADVEQELVEHPTGQLGPHVVAHRGAVGEAIEGARALGSEAEEVTEVDRLRRQQVGCRRGLVAGGGEIDVLRRSGAVAEAVVEGQGALQDPPLRGHRDEASQQPIEGDLLAQSNHRAPGVARVRRKTRLEGSTEGAGGGVPHPPAPESAASTSRWTR